MPRPLRSVLFRTHWLLGWTAGLVLAIVGTTGALLSFEAELLEALNPGFRVVPAGQLRSADAWLDAARAANPGWRVQGLVWNGRAAPVDVRMARGPSGPQGTSRVIAVDPYSLGVFGERRGEATFHTIEQLHRNLTVGPVGKQVVGASVVALIVMAITGLVLRWPRRATSPRDWLALDFKLRGRAFLWRLHTVIATWCLAFYLLAALTGLWWSYESYRAVLARLAGVPAPTAIQRAGGGAPAQPPPTLPASLHNAWHVLAHEAPNASRAMLSAPRASDAPLEWRYLDADAPHARAFNTLKLDTATGALIVHERYAAQPLGKRLYGSVFTLHNGAYFGRAGQIAMFLAAALMPFFAVTGILMWVSRRRLRAMARASANAMGRKPMAGATWQAQDARA